MNKSVSNKDLNKTMSFILNHKNLSNKDIDELTSTSESRNALAILKAMKAIGYKISMSGNYHNFKILDDGILYFYRKKQERIGFWNGFLTGIISTVVTTLIVNLIMLLISKVKMSAPDIQALLPQIQGINLSPKFFHL